MAKSKYEELLAKTAAAYSLMTWVSDQGGGRHGTKESNLWALARLAAEAEHYFLSHLVKLKIDEGDEEFDAAEAQAALEGLEDQPAGADDMKRAILAFLGSQQLEHDDTNRNDFEAEDEAEGDEMEDVAPAAVASALHQVDRPLTTEVTALWSPRERVLAFRWAEHKKDGGGAPPPEMVSRRYLEDLDTDTPEGLAELLDWLDIPGVGEELPDGWSDEDTEALRAWAIGAHVIDRGGDPKRLIDLTAPQILLPEPDLFAKIKAFIHHEPCSRERIIDTFRPEDYGVAFALDALHVTGEVSFHEVSAFYRAPAAELVGSLVGSPEEDLALVARQVAERRAVRVSADDEEIDEEPADEGQEEEAPPSEPEPTESEESVKGDDPKADGAAAFEAGREQEDNPYDPDGESEAFLAWHDGFSEAEIAAEKKPAAVK